MSPSDFFWRAAARWPGNIAIDAPEGAIRYDALAAQVAALATALNALDNTLQSRVGICAKNSAEHIVALLAVLACGTVWVPLNPKSTRPEIRRIIDATEPSILVLDVACAGLLEGAAGARIYSGSPGLGAAGGGHAGDQVHRRHHGRAQGRDAAVPRLDDQRLQPDPRLGL